MIFFHAAVALMVAPTNELVRQLNEKAAMFYRDNGTVSGREVELADGLRAAVGDVVVTRKNTSKFAVTATGKGKAGRIKNDELRIFDAKNASPWDQIGRLMQVANLGGAYRTSNTTSQQPGQNPFMNALGIGLGAVGLAHADVVHSLLILVQALAVVAVVLVLLFFERRTQPRAGGP